MFTIKTCWSRYPGICHRAFQIFNCRDLGNFSVLVERYSVECNTHDHFAHQIVSGAVIVLIALGPTVLVYTVRQRRKEYGSGTPVDALVATRAAEELGVQEIAAADAICDVATGREYSFLINSFQSHLNYWEGIDMLRKLVLVSRTQSMFSVRNH